MGANPEARPGCTLGKTKQARAQQDHARSARRTSQAQRRWRVVSMKRRQYYKRPIKRHYGGELP
jgi:hypothetical protein